MAVCLIATGVAVRGQRVSLQLNIFNSPNANTPTGVTQRSGATFLVLRPVVTQFSSRGYILSV